MAKDKWRSVQKPKPELQPVLAPAQKEQAERAVAAEVQKPARKTLLSQIPAAPKGDGTLVSKLPPDAKPLKPQKKKIPLKLFLAVVAVPIVVVAILTYVVHLI